MKPPEIYFSEGQVAACFLCDRWRYSGIFLDQLHICIAIALH
jgi:hypothetical protein